MIECNLEGRVSPSTSWASLLSGIVCDAGTGWDAIQAQLKKLEAKHALHIASYGEGNERRLTGKHETSSMNDFRYEHHLSLQYLTTNCLVYLSLKADWGRCNASDSIAFYLL